MINGNEEDIKNRTITFEFSKQLAHKSDLSFLREAERIVVKIVSKKVTVDQNRKHSFTALLPNQELLSVQLVEQTSGSKLLYISSEIKAERIQGKPDPTD